MSRRIVQVLAVWCSAVLAVGLMASMAVPTSAAAQPIPANFDASAMDGNEAEDAIAVNPVNPSNVVTMSTLPDVVSGAVRGRFF
jgi:hypothetical protein